jgi:hypothetical protein
LLYRAARESLKSHYLALGLHYAEGEVWDKAVVHLRRSAARALRQPLATGGARRAALLGGSRPARCHRIGYVDPASPPWRVQVISGGSQGVGLHRRAQRGSPSKARHGRGLPDVRSITVGPPWGNDRELAAPLLLLGRGLLRVRVRTPVFLARAVPLWSETFDFGGQHTASRTRACTPHRQVPWARALLCPSRTARRAWNAALASVTLYWHSESQWAPRQRRHVGRASALAMR